MGAKKKPKPIITQVDITGPVGCGKTTIMHEIVQALSLAGRHVAHSRRDALSSGAERVVLIIDHSDDGEPRRRGLCGRA